jgi:hypothetical protein
VLVFSSRMSGFTMLDIHLVPIVVGQFALILDADHRARGAGSPRRRADARLRLAIITLSALIGVGSEALILSGAAAAGPNDARFATPKSTAAPTTEPRPRTTTDPAPSAEPVSTATPSTGPLTADDYCGYEVADRLEAYSAVDMRDLFTALIERGADWAGCPTAPPVRFGQIEVWQLEHPSPERRAGILIAGPRCRSAVIAPDLSERALELLRTGELHCASGWTVSEPTRLQVFEMADGCVVLLQRDVQSEYREIPGAVAEIAARLGSGYRARPFVQSVATDDAEATYFIAFDAPSRGLFNLYATEVSLNLRTGRATATPHGQADAITADGESCPTTAQMIPS